VRDRAYSSRAPAKLGEGEHIRLGCFGLNTSIRAMLPRRPPAPCEAQQFRYVRVGGAFADWRRRHRIHADPHQRKEVLRKRENRKATRSDGWKYRDMPLCRRTWKLGDEHILGTLYRTAPSAGNPARAGGSAPSPNNYPSALGAASQSPSLRRDETIRQQVSTLSKAESASGQNFDGVTRRFGLAGYRANMVARVYRCNGVGPLQVTPDRRTTCPTTLP
jgi:hypothetical protein